MRTISVEIGRFRYTILLVCDHAFSICSKLTNETARAPNGYYTGGPETIKKSSRDKKKDKKAEKPVTREWHEGPPRVGTFSMRATRFRLGAGCLSWAKKDGTVAKNQRILDVIPAQYKDPAVNSTRGWRDLNKAEMKTVKAGALKKPQLGPKDKRAADAAKKADELQIGKDAEEGRQSGHAEYADADAREDFYVSEVHSNVKDAAFSVPRPSASIKQEEGTDTAGGHPYLQMSRKRSLGEDSGYSRDLEDNSESRPSKKRRTHNLPQKSQGTGDSTISAPRKLQRIRKPRHGDFRAPEPKQKAEQSALFSSPLDQYDQQDPHPHAVHSRNVLDAAMPSFYGDHGQAYGNGQTYHSRGSNVYEDIDEWSRSEMQEYQMYECYRQDSIDNDHLQQSIPHQNEGFAQSSPSTGFHPGFAGVHSQGRGLGMSHNVHFPPGAQYANFQSESQLGFLPSSLPQGSPQYDFYGESLPQTVCPQNDDFYVGSNQGNVLQASPWY